MAMGIVSEEIFNAEIVATNHKRVEPQIIDINRGRGNVNSVPQGLRKVVAEEAISGSPVEELAKIFGVSKSSISAYKNGATSTASYHEPDKNLKTRVDEVKSEIAFSAMDKIKAALSHITEGKLEGETLRDVSGIAKDMATVMEKMEGKANTIDKQVNQVIVYAPRMREEDDYNIIDISA